MADLEYISSQTLLKRAEILYQFVDLFESYENLSRNYFSIEGSELFTMNEVHLLAAIEANPGIISTDLALKTRKSKSLISQIVSKFVKYGYIVKMSEKESSQKKQLFVTAKGKKLCEAHAEFDEKTLIKTYNYLLRDCTPEEISSFYKVMEVYNHIMLAAEKKRQNHSQ